MRTQGPGREWRRQYRRDYRLHLRQQRATERHKHKQDKRHPMHLMSPHLMVILLAILLLLLSM